MKDLHKRAVDLWVFSKQRSEEGNPSAAIVFALLNRSMPPSVTMPQNTVQLCELINHMQESPALTDEEKKEIELFGVHSYLAQRSGKSPLISARRLIHLNRLGYISGAGVMIFAGFSWWVAGFMLATWWAFGAGRMAAQMLHAGKYSEAKMRVNYVIYIVALVGLYGSIILKIAGKI
jgi:hypothetical protein